MSLSDLSKYTPLHYLLLLYLLNAIQWHTECIRTESSHQIINVASAVTILRSIPWLLLVWPATTVSKAERVQHVKWRTTLLEFLANIRC